MSYSKLDIKKIFITGGTGFIGRHLVERLSSKYKLTILARSHYGAKIFESHTNIKVVTGDITKPETYKDYLEDIDVVFHLAFLVSDWASKREFKRININGTRTLFHLAEGAGIKRFIYVSSASVYDSSVGVYGFSNHKFNNSELPYISTSVEVERFLCKKMESSKMEIIIVRPVWVYGPGDKKFFTGIIKYVKSGFFPIISFRDNRIPLIYIDNLISILERTLIISQVHGKILLAADKEELTWKEFVNIIANKLGAQVRFYRLPRTFAYAVAYVCELFIRFFHLKKRPPLTRFVVHEMSKDIRIDMSETEKILGYRQLKTLDEGINEVLKYTTL